MINLSVANEDQIVKAGLDKQSLGKFTKEFTSMTEELDKTLGGDWYISIRPANFGASIANVSIEGKVDGKDVLIKREILSSFEDKAKSFNLKHEYFSIDEKLQGKGIANIVNKVSYNLGKEGFLEGALVDANIDIGGYAWLRKGAWPFDGAETIREIADNSLRYNSLKRVNDLAGEFLNIIEDMSDKELRAYVLTDSFSKYKEVFLNCDWSGSFNLQDDLVRASLIGDKQAQGKLLWERIQKLPGTMNALPDQEILRLQEIARTPVKKEPKQTKPKKPATGKKTSKKSAEKAVTKTPKSNDLPSINPLSKTANEEILDGYIKQQTYLLRYADGLSAELMGVLSKTDKPLNDALVSWLSEAQGSNLYDKNGRAWQAEFEDAVKSIREPAWDEIQAALSSQLEAAAVANAAATATLIQGAVPVLLGLQMPPPDKLVAIVRSQPLQGKVLKEWMEKAKRSDVDGLVTQAKAGIIQGKTPIEVTREIMGSRAEEFADGIAKKKAQRDVQTLVRTITNGVQNEAKQALYEANADIIAQEQFVATLDARTTLQCGVNDNKVFERGKGPIPPLHFNCRSLRVPYLDPDLLGDRAFDPSTEKTLVKAYAEKNDLTGIKTRADLPRGTKGDFDKFARQRRRELIGQVPATTSYQEWLKKQSPDFQDEVLGKAKAAMLRNGDITLDKFVSRDGEPLTLKQLNEKTSGIAKAAAKPNPVDRTVMRLAYGDPYTYTESRHTKLFDEFRPQIKAIPKEDRLHLRNYVFDDDNFKAINNALRNGSALPKALEAQKQSMDKILNNHQVTAQTLFRGDTSLPVDFAAAQKLVGNKLQNKGYMSTSLSPETAASFGGNQTSAVLEFHPDTKPIKGIYAGALDPDPKNPDSYLNLMEREVLLPSGKNYQINGVRQEEIFNPDYMEKPIKVTVYEASFLDD